MSIATKPNALLYLPPILIAVFLGARGPFSDSTGVSPDVKSALGVTASNCILPAVLGGFWYGKNLFFYRTINPIGTVRESVIFWNLLSPGMLRTPSFWSILVPSAAGVALFVMVVLRGAKIQQPKIRFYCIVACLFLLGGLLGFLFTPKWSLSAPCQSL